MTLRVTPAEIVGRVEAAGSPGLLAKAPHWSRVRLGDVARVVNGAAFKSSHFNVDGRGMPLIRIRDVGGSTPSTWYDGPWEKLHLVQRNDILVGMDGDFRAARWLSDPGLLNQRVCRIDTDARIYDDRFLVLVLQGYLDAIWAATSSTTVKHLSSRSVADIPLPQPDLGEQRKIVEILEDHLSRLDAARAIVDASRRRLTRFHQAIMVSVLDAAAADSTTSVTTIGELAQVGTGATPLKSRTDYYSGGDIPWVTSADLAVGKLETAKQFITPLALKETSVRLWPAGTLLVAMYGEGKTRGTVAELGFGSTTNQACAAIRLSDRDNSLRAWVRMALEAQYLAMRRLGSGGVQPNLNLGLVRRIEIAVPSAEVRASLLEVRARQEEAQRALADELMRAQRRGSSLRRALLNSAFSGRLTGRSSDLDRVEEMASQ